jgi:hypothetical protein
MFFHVHPEDLASTDIEILWLVLFEMKDNRNTTISFWAVLMIL